MSLILGTANFSKNYGAFSLKNKDENELKTLIEFAQKKGLHLLSHLSVLADWRNTSRQHV